MSVSTLEYAAEGDEKEISVYIPSAILKLAPSYDAFLRAYLSSTLSLALVLFPVI